MSEPLPRKVSPKVSDKKVLRDALLSCLVVLLTIGVLYAILMPTYNRARRLSVESNKGEANTRAIKNAVGFTFTAVNTEQQGRWKDDGMQILQVTPGGPAARAGLLPGDRIRRLRYPVIKQRLVAYRGKALALPVERNGKHIDCTIAVPKFTLPFPSVPF